MLFYCFMLAGGKHKSKHRHTHTHAETIRREQRCGARMFRATACHAVAKYLLHESMYSIAQFASEAQQIPKKPAAPWTKRKLAQQFTFQLKIEHGPSSRNTHHKQQEISAVSHANSICCFFLLPLPSISSIFFLQLRLFPFVQVFLSCSCSDAEFELIFCCVRS